MKTVYLISSLGMSPGVVTGVIDCLQYNDLEESYNPTHLAIITTDNPLTLQSLKVIEHDVQKFNSHIILKPYVIKGLSDISTREDNYAVIRTFISAIKEGIKLKNDREVDEIHVNIAGGRKTMSGLFTSLSNIFPVDRLYHLITTNQMELRGHIKNFLDENNELDLERLDNEELKHNLHPKLINEYSVLVEIPILRGLELEELIEINRRITAGRNLTPSKIITDLIKQGILKRTGENKYSYTKKGLLIKDLIEYYLKS
ncbi:MAG: CRISPR-associated ring nuclease [Promethearchaeota archaeon]